MKITGLEVLDGKEIPFPAPYLPAWNAPGGVPANSFRTSIIKISTDEGICGYGPCFGKPDAFIQNYLVGTDPLLIEQFWHDCMNGREPGLGRVSYGGIDIALWDIAGKVSGLPVSRMLGAKTDKVPVYAATSRLLNAGELAAQALELQSLGFKTIKIRLHRQDYKDDIKAAQAVRKACPDLFLMADANQSNKSIGYNYWSRETALLVARELQDLGLGIIEEPLNRYDLEGLGEITDSLTIRVSGGEHGANINEFREYLLRGTYDIIQPDPILGDIGVTGMRKLGVVSGYLGRQIVPHICSLGGFALSFAATIQVMSGLTNCPVLEFPYDPPFLTNETQQYYIGEKFWIDGEGCVSVQQTPGIGVSIYEDAL
jgi:L-alanine-DL-glutamate epimerase-like enolase superfamily enzyme